jgi:hypothetical protein
MTLAFFGQSLWKLARGPRRKARANAERIDFMWYFFATLSDDQFLSNTIACLVGRQDIRST